MARKATKRRKSYHLNFHFLVFLVLAHREPPKPPRTLYPLRPPRGLEKTLPKTLKKDNQERKRHINLRKTSGTPAGCPWDTRRDKQGSTGRCPRYFLLFAIEKRTEKSIFAGTPAGCPRDTRPSIRTGKNNKLNFLWPKMARLGPRFGPPKSPEKVYVYVPLLRSFPGNEAHKLFLGGPKSGVLGGGQKVYVEKVYVLFPSLNRGVLQKIYVIFLMCLFCPLNKEFPWSEKTIWNPKRQGMEDQGQKPVIAKTLIMQLP